MKAVMLALVLIVGTAHADRLVGTDRPDQIRARAGNDRIRPRGGIDEIWCGPGFDTLLVEDLNDIHHGCEAIVYSPP